jgi:hypothetical protein
LKYARSSGNEEYNKTIIAPQYDSHVRCYTFCGDVEGDTFVTIASAREDVVRTTLGARAREKRVGLIHPTKNFRHVPSH